MTMLIRVILFPLTHKSFVSMQKMQELNPKVQAVRQKYRGKLKDKQGRPRAEVQRKMNEEVMALYKSEGVNPAGGCLPMLLQIPVLFAFYNLLTAAFELRHAPWLFWIQDLSAPDPYYVLPIVMGASQFIQQRLTPSAADPMQRRIFMLMPLFFTILFLGFPSGLVLYWLTNNLLGIAQQGVYQRLRHPAGGRG
jgi:YidC/Oxa1 family membrane protein insertase